MGRSAVPTHQARRELFVAARGNAIMRTDNELSHDGGISVKLHRASDNAKIELRPYHLKLAIMALTREYCDLDGPEEAGRELITAVATAVAQERNLPVEKTSIISVAVEVLVNQDRNNIDNAAMIVKELGDIFDEGQLAYAATYLTGGAK